MAEETQNPGLSKGMLVMCRLGDQTLVGPCRVVYVGPDYVTVEDPEQNMWQTLPARVEPADEQLSDMLNTQA